MGALVLDLFPGQTELIVDQLNGTPELQFRYMKEVMQQAQSRRTTEGGGGRGDGSGGAYAGESSGGGSSSDRGGVLVSTMCDNQ